MTQSTLSPEKNTAQGSRTKGLTGFLYAFGNIKSLQLKIALWAGALLLGLSAILTVYSSLTSRAAAIEAAELESLAFAASESALIRADSEVPLDTARALANAITAIKDPNSEIELDRADVNAMLRQVLAQNPAFLGTYTLWEPNAFDGLDTQFAGTETHDDTGRFIPYWVRNADGSISVSALVDYETPGLGDWYLLPRQQKNEVAIAPVFYSIEGVNTVMASFVVPVVYDGKFYGIVGVDAPLGFVQEIVDSVDLFEGTTQAALLTTSGTLIGVSDRPELVNLPATEVFPDFETLQPDLEAGEAFVRLSPDGKFLRVFSPVTIGNTGSKWVFALNIPYNQVTADATATALQQALIGLVLAAVALALLWGLSGQIVRPVRTLTNVAYQVSQGNLDITADIATSDETGLLANAFNQMISQLRNLFATLEQRVAERTESLELAAEVGRVVSQVRDLDILLKDAAELIRSRFNLYYVQVYLLNPSRTELILQAGTGTVGAELIARGHRLPLTIGSLNGRAVLEKTPVIVSDTTRNVSFRANALLPDTRSEMVIPLTVGERVVGVLDLQSSVPGALNEETLSAFEALAGQLAVTIQNAGLLAETRRARSEVEVQARRLARSSWDTYLDAIHKPEKFGFVFEQDRVLPLEESPAPAESADELAIPISVVGEPVGTLSVQIDADKRTASTNQIIDVVAAQVARQIENLRLIESAERYRIEAEESARRLTREGWEEYLKAKSVSSINFFYDTKSVQPVQAESPVETPVAANIPIRVREEAIGRLAVLGEEPLDPESREIIAAVTARLGQHIEGLRLLEETQLGQLELNKRARQLAAVSEISTVSSRELDIEKMLATVVFMTQRRFGLYHAHVFTFNENTQNLEIVACGWKEGDEHEGTHGTTTIPLSQEQSLVARAGRNRQAVIANDVHKDEGWLPNPLMPDTAAEMAVPLVIGDQLLGVLDVQSEHLNAFTDEDVSIFATLAAQVATALQNAHSFARAQRQAEREAMLNAISQKIQSATSVEAVLQIAARELGHALGAPRTVAQLSMKDKK